VNTATDAPSCSAWARSQHLDPAGSAAPTAGYLLVEQPLPWPSDIGDLDELAEVAAVAGLAGLRLQAVVAPDSTREQRRLIAYTPARPGWSGPLERRQVTVSASDLVEGARAVVGPSAPAPDNTVTEVMVCTHGRRDACCGSAGMALFDDLGRSPLAEQVRLWRTSHTGGHRFAPTAIVLPSATVWAYADRELLRGAIQGGFPPVAAAERFRGCATLASPAAQAVERAVFALEGWALLSRFRQCRELGEGRVRYQVDGWGAWEAVVRPGRRIPAPDCRTPPEQARKTSTELVVDELRRLADPLG
jgi:hypothetical protein